MRASKERRRRNYASSPTKTNRGQRPTTSSPPPPPPPPDSIQYPRSPLSSSASLLDRDILTQEFSYLQISSPDEEEASPNPNPRSFPYSVKQQCWEKAEKLKGRDPDRWRRDPLGNIVFRKLVGCPGCLCHDYDHIVPYSKGGKSTLENCQVLQATVNRSKGNRTEFSKAELIQKSSYCRVSGRDMDLIELSAYGNVRRGQDSGGCRIQ